MSEYVRKRGKVIVINPEKDKTMVQVTFTFFNIYFCKEKVIVIFVFPVLPTKSQQRKEMQLNQNFIFFKCIC